MSIDSSGVTATGLVEREPEMTALRVAVASAREGRGSTVVVSGEAGMGKTSLVRAFRRELGDSAAVLVGACEDLLAPRPLGPFRDILRRARGQVFDQTDVDRERCIVEMLDLMGGSLRPTIAVIEDCHWADDGSLDMIRYLGRRMGEMPAVMIVTYRPDTDRVDRRVARAIGSLSDVVHLELSALSPTAVAALATAAGRDPEAIVPLVGGNPFYLNEILASTGTEIPLTIRQAVGSQMLGFDEDTRRALELVSVAPDGAKIDLIEALVAGGMSCIAPAEEAGLIRVEGDLVRFRHELTRLTVEHGLGDSYAIGLNRQILRHLLLGRADPAVLVHYAVAARDFATVVSQGPIATDAAARMGDHSGTITLSQVTLRQEADLDTSTAARLYAHAAYAHYASNRFGDAAEAALASVERWRQLGESAELANTLLMAARQHIMTGFTDKALHLAEEAFDLLEAAGDSRDLALACAMIGNIESLKPNAAVAAEWCDRAIDIAESVGADEVVAHALIYRSVARLSLGDLTGFDDSTRAIAIARRIDHGDFLCRAAANRAAALTWWGRHPEAEPYIDVAEAVAREHSLDYLVFHLAGLRSHLDLFAGRWSVAEDRLRRHLATAGDPAALKVIPLAILGRICIRRGDTEGSDLILEAWRTAVRSRQMWRLGLAGGAMIERAWLDGDDEAVLAMAETLLPLAEDAHLVYLRGEVLRYMARIGVTVAGFDRCPPGFAAGLSGDWSGAISAWESVGNPYEQALEMCDAPESEVAFAGLRLLEDLGAAATANRFRQILRQRGLSGIPRGPRQSTRDSVAPLTPRQLEVLGLVAAGLTSTEIANRLFLSSRTIDNHISAITTRLGASTRAEAAQMAMASGWVPRPG